MSRNVGFPETGKDLAHPRCRLVNKPDQGLQLLGPGFWKNTVSQVENMARASFCSGQYFFCPSLDQLPITKYGCGVKIALNSNVAQSIPRLINRNPPVHAEHFAACLPHRLENSCCAHSKMYSWNPSPLQAVHDSLGIG